MSVTLAQVAKLLSASNEQLFDRYINFRLSQYEPKASTVTVAKSASELISSMFSGIPFAYTPDFVVKTPVSGIKPHITVSGTLNTQNNVNIITLTVMNMNANIDTMAYNWCEIEVGYLNSGIHTRFCGQVTNCYMAKPNPNGELVVNVVNANITELYEQGSFDVRFASDTVDTVGLIRTCINAIKSARPKLASSLKLTDIIARVPALWRAQTFVTNKTTYNFRSPMACITWLNSLFAAYTVNTGFASGAGALPLSSEILKQKSKLPPLRLGFTSDGRLVCRGVYSDIFPGATKGLACLGSAFLTGEAATITAPFNPDIAPGEVIFVDPKFYKTRVNVAQVRAMYASLGNLWWVISMQFTFSTATANTMTLQLNNIKNTIESGEG